MTRRMSKQHQNNTLSSPLNLKLLILIQILYRDQILEEFTMPHTHAPAPTPPTAATSSSAHPILYTPDDIAS